MTEFETYLLAQADSPALLSALLFTGPFVLEEAAILAGSALAAAGALSPFVVVAVLYAGIVASDWLLYFLGAVAGRNARVRLWIGAENIETGRRLLQGGAMAAAVSARVVPWLLLPIFVASGFVGVAFVRFAVVNAIIALIYVNVLFWGIYSFNIVLFDHLGGWAWLFVILLSVGLILFSRRIARRFGKSQG